MKTPLSKWSKVLIISFLFLFLVLLIFQFALNSQKIQFWAINLVNKHIGIEAEWSELNFSAATGQFSGKNLKARLPQARLEAEINDFKIIFNPFKLIFKKIHLFDFEANDVQLKILEKTKKTSPKKNKKPQDFNALLDLFQIDSAKISKVSLIINEKSKIYASQISIKEKSPFLFYKRALEIKIVNFKSYQKKHELFADEFIINGSFNLVFNEAQNKYEPKVDATIKLDQMLLGFQKRATPWNDSEGWEESLNPILEKYYGLPIPERSYAYFDEVQLPFYLGPKQIKISNSTIKAFNGKSQVNLDWNRRSKDINLSLKQIDNMQLRYFPLGKSNFRRSFDKVNLNIEAKGYFSNLLSGNLESSISLDLLNHLTVPSTDKLSLRMKGSLTNGIADIKKLTINLLDGNLHGKGKIDLHRMKVESQFGADNIDAQSVIRLFSSVDIPGKANASGGINGFLNNPHFKFQINSDEFGYEFLKAGSFNGSLEIKDHNLLLLGKTKTPDEGSGQFSLDITSVFKSANQKVNLDTKLTNYPAQYFLQTEALEGTINGEFKMDKARSDYNGTGQIEASNLKWFWIPIDKIKSQFKMDEVGQQKKIELFNTSFDWPELYGKDETLKKSLSFLFDSTGFSFKGPLLSSLEVISGEHRYDDADWLKLSLDAKNLNIKSFDKLLPLSFDELVSSGKFNAKYHLKDIQLSELEAWIDKFDLKLDEKTISLQKKSKLSYVDQTLQFDQTKLQFGQGNLTINGPLSVNGQSNLSFKGRLDLSQLEEMHPKLLESDGFTVVDINWKGSLTKPEFYGSIDFNNNALLIQSVRSELNEINGRLEMNGKRINFKSLRALYDEAPIRLNGWVEWDNNNNISDADIKIVGQEVPFYKEDEWRALSDLDLNLKGSDGQHRISGNVRLVDGLFYKDYSLSQFIFKPVGVYHQKDESMVPQWLSDAELNIDIKPAGEFRVKNNFTELSLSPNVLLRGTLAELKPRGNIEILEGQLYALGLNFKDAEGFITLAEDRQPYVEMRAVHLIRDYEVRTVIQGYMNNIALKLESTPSLTQNEIVSLIAYGQTPDELASNKRNLFSRAALASQVVSVLQRPITKATDLDIVRVETDYTQTDDDETFSSFAIGKQLSDRFSVTVTAGLNLEARAQGLGLEYLLTDNLLLKAVKDTGTRYRFDLTWRFDIF